MALSGNTGSVNLHINVRYGKLCHRDDIVQLCVIYLSITWTLVINTMDGHGAWRMTSVDISKRNNLFIRCCLLPENYFIWKVKKIKIKKLFWKIKKILLDEVKRIFFCSRPGHIVNRIATAFSTCDINNCLLQSVN